MDFDALYSLVRDTYPFNGAKYPKIRGANDAQRRDFAVRHILSHCIKQAGKIAEACERADHEGRGVCTARLDEAAVKMFVNSVRLAEVLGIRPQQLLKLAEEQQQQHAAQDAR